MNSVYEPAENMVAAALFNSISLAVTGILMLGIAIWSLATERADVTIIGIVVVSLVAFAVSLYFFGQYREEKRERAKRQEERVAVSTQKG